MVKIAVVEDEKALRLDLVDYLCANGHIAFGCEDGQALDALCVEHTFDVVILDLNLPGENGFSIANRLYKDGPIGIIILSARSQSIDRIVGLEMGADVYMTKPVELRELEAQVRALARRRGDANESGAPNATPGPAPRPTSETIPDPETWCFDSVAWTLSDPQGKEMKLTTNERIFFSCLAERPSGEALTRDEIMAALGKRRWDPGDRSIDALVHRLQTKAMGDLRQRLPLSAVHGSGYAFNAPLISMRHNPADAR